MGLPNVDCDVKSSGRAAELWGIEFTFTGATGEVALDTVVGEGGAWVDEDPRVETPVADSGTTGLTTIRFPKSRRVRIVHCSLEEPTAGTGVLMAQLVDVLPLSGSASFRVVDGTFALAHGTQNARGRILLMLEYN